MSLSISTIGVRRGVQAYELFNHNYESFNLKYRRRGVMAYESFNHNYRRTKGRGNI